MNQRPDQLTRIANIDTSAWKSLRAFISLIGKWWFSVWILTILSGVVSFGLTVANVTQFPTYIWVGLLIIGLVLGPSVAFHSLRVERDSLRLLIDDKEVVLHILNDLEGLRSEAANLQVEGRQISKAEFEEWNSRVSDWMNRTRSKLAELHPAEAGNFNTLGVFDAKLSMGTKIVSNEQQTALLNLIRRLDILGEIRDRWTRSA